MLYLVEYLCGATLCSAFVKAANENDAFRITKEILDSRTCKVLAAHDAEFHQITPQSITLNFRNTSEYNFF